MSDDAEALARAEGWKPQDEFVADGKPAEQWVDAQTFLERGKNINAILRKNNTRLQNEIARLQGELETTNLSVKQIQEYHAKIEKNAYDRALRDLRAEKRAAIAAGEHEAAAELEEQIDALRDDGPPKPPDPPAKKEPENKLDPLITEWIEDNSDWFNDENPDLVGYANGVGQRLRKSNPDLVGKPFLAKVKEQVKKAFPDRFEPDPSARGGAVDDGSSSSPVSRTGGGRSGTLPADAAREKATLVKQQWYKDLAKAQGKTPEKMFDDDYFGTQ